MASSIVTSAAQQLGGLMAKEAKHLYRVSEKIELVQRDLRWMQCFLEDADDRQHSDKVVAMWVDEIRDFAYEAEEIIEKYVHKVSHPRQNGKWNTIRWMVCALSDAQALHEVGSDIDGLRTRIAELVSRLQLYGVKTTKKQTKLGSNPAIWDQRQTYSHNLDYQVGLEKHISLLKDKLLTHQQVRIVGVYGMGGLGKTTLARKVFQDTTTREHFKNRAWVCISKKFEARVVFRNILKELTNSRNEKEKEKFQVRDLTDGELPLKICEILEQNACLVVLDDVWSNADWNALKPAFDSISSSPSKILITTRNNGLIRQGDPLEYSHSLNLLDDQDSWKLFRRIAFLEGEIPEAESLSLEEMESDQTTEDSESKAKQKMGWKMLKHCKGLPLAILTLGGVLREKKTVAEWETVQKNITSYLMGDMEQGTENNGLFGMLELSFHDLPFYLKPCFMYLGVYPEDHLISTLKLYHLWEAEGLVTLSKDGDEIQDVRMDDVAELYLNELVKRCLVQVHECWANGRISKIRLHDVLRDMCLKKCKEANFLSILRHGVCTSTKIANTKPRRCALYLGDIKSDDLPFDPSLNLAPCIRSLLVFQDSEPRKVFSPKMGNFFSLLRVLDHEKSCDILQQPKILKNFIHLRYLSFKRAVLPDTLIASLSSRIWECKFLETLDLRVQFGTYAFVLLSNKLWKLTSLRHLYLPDLVQFSGKSRWLILTDSQLQQMETFKNFDKSVCHITDLRKMASLRVVSFLHKELSTKEVEHLLMSPMISERRLVKPLHLRVHPDVIKEADNSLLAQIQSRVCISKLDIRGRIDAAVNLDILHKMNLTKLFLEHSRMDEQGISVLEKLLHLKELVLEGWAIAGSKMRFRNGSFPQLDKLLFLSLFGLQEWEIEEGAVPNLQTLTVHFCEELKMIPLGLPNTVYVDCLAPCISGVDNYNVCPHASFVEQDDTPPESFTSIAKTLVDLCVFTIRTKDGDLRF